ncbi:SpoIIE family protein phosphatase [Streptomyces sp. NPDC056488]|uniref:SpoIIE family protein phosphatase n=1 Tax=unclassified Streptomyces TaxID=2593676 RepID=UPI00369776AE
MRTRPYARAREECDHRSACVAWEPLPGRPGNDGVTEARSPGGDFYGEERLADTVIRATAAGAPAPEALRRLVQGLWQHQSHKLRDDATILLTEWHPRGRGGGARPDAAGGHDRTPGGE